MDWTAFSNLSPGMFAAGLAIYYSNALALRYLEERKEFLAEIVAERKAWEASNLRLLDRYDTRAEESVRQLAIHASTVHTLKGVNTAMNLRVEALQIMVEGLQQKVEGVQQKIDGLQRLLEAWMVKDKSGSGHD